MRRAWILAVILLLLMTGCEYLPGERGNESPVAYIDSITPAEAADSETVSFTGHGTDSDGTVVAYRWRSDLDGELSVEPEFRTDLLSRGTHNIFFKVQDNNGAWSEEVSGTVTVTAPAVPVPVIAFFTANPPTINPDGSSVLSWSVSGADSVDIVPDIGDVPPEGTSTVFLSTTTGFTLTASNKYGTVNTELTVTVTKPTYPEDIQELVLHTIAYEDGSLVKYSESYERQETPCAGDNSGSLAVKAFLSFDISSIPQDAIIEAAMLDLTDCTVIGEPTYVKGMHGNMGALEFYYYQYGSYEDLGREAYMRIAPFTANGVQQEYPLNPWRWDISESDKGEPIVQQLVESGALRCQIRIQFFTSTNWDGVADMICFENATLTVYYRVP
jgi:hypothetical protein